MDAQVVNDLFERFENAAAQVNGVECWSARELCPLFGYAQWRNFTNAIDKAKESCKNATGSIQEHFADVSKTYAMPKEQARPWMIFSSQGMPVTLSHRTVIRQNLKLPLLKHILQFRQEGQSLSHKEFLMLKGGKPEIV